MDDFTRAESAAQFLLSQTPVRPAIGLVLGSGLGAFADEFSEATRIPYASIPSFPRSTAVGHAGQMVIGKVGEVAVAAMQGRVHLYEGYSSNEVAFPTRVFGRMGIRALILTNAAGGINLEYKKGALVVITDHINLQGNNPLVGPNDDRFGPRFPDMSQAYWKPYREIALRADARGQYAADTLVNGMPVRMLVDTGASDIVISASTAARLGLAPSSAPARIIQTANGRSTASPAVLSNVSFGGLYMNDVEALILAPEAGEVNLLGASFLRRLVSVEQRDGMLILRQ